jgi:DNA polymerase-3 subunit gamma/tau
MAYQSLYRRYRPRRFADVRGQEHLVTALRNAVREDRIGHAYLFSGPRGTGKTSTARILAKVLNCEAPVDGEPCGECPSCLAIDAGTSFDVHELDAASNNGVEAVRDLIAKASLGTPGRTKVYILDEVHMLSTAASNALLKTLEEPPDHVVFVLATTDPQKVLPTIRSRTQHFEVHLLPAADLAALVDHVVTDAGLTVDDAGRAYVLRAGGGSARDTLSALDRVVAAGGVPDDVDAVDGLVEALCDRDTGRALIAVEDALARGRSPRVLGESLIARLRDVFLASMGADLGRLTEQDRERCAEQAGRLTPAGATRALEVLGDAFVGIQDALDPRIPLEVALVRLTRPDLDTTPQALAERLTRLERTLADGVVPPPAATGPARRAASPAEAPAPATPAAPAAHDDASPAEGGPEDDADDERRPASPGGAPPSPAGVRPGDSARQALARHAPGSGRDPSARSAPPSRPAPGRPASPGGAPPSPGSRPGSSGPTAPRPAPPAGDRPSAPEPPGAASATTSAPGAGGAGAAAGAGAGAGAGASGGELPSREELTMAWPDRVLPALSQTAKVRFGPGRFVGVEDGAALYGFPNAHYVGRGEAVRAEVEAALAQHFGRPVPIRIVIDEQAEPPPSPGVVRAPDPSSPTDDEAIDLTDLVDATDLAETSVDRVTAVFPGAELIDEGPDRLV